MTALAPRDVIALIETPRGAVFAAEIAAAEGTVAMMWGAEDLVAALGGSSSRQADGSYRDVGRHVRSTVLLAASTFDRVALDAVYLDIGDLDGLQVEANDGVAVGFGGTVCIHRLRFRWCPRPIGPVRRSWTGREGCWRRRGPSEEYSRSKDRWSTRRCSSIRR